MLKITLYLRFINVSLQEAFAIDIAEKYQRDFTKGRSASDLISTLRQTMEKYYELDLRNYIYRF
jgi:hypothetical protein